MNNDSSALPLPEPDPPKTPPESGKPEKAKRKRRAPGMLNEKQQRELNRASQMVAAAKKPEYAPALEEQDIPPALVEELELAIKATRKRSEAAANATVSKESETAAGATAKEALVKCLRRIQAAARNAFSETEPMRLNSYFVGSDIAGNRGMLDAVAVGMIDRATEDQLPGITPEFLEEVEARRKAYTKTVVDQQRQLGLGMNERGLVQGEIDWIRARRKKIQYAADAAWPWSNPASAKARVEFQLPARRPYCY